jgi:para-aminobenzoate synthetase component I
MKTRMALNGNDGNWRIGIGESACLEMHVSDSMELLEDFLQKHAGRTTFILLSYELRKHWYKTGSPAGTSFPLLKIWVPESFYTVKNGVLRHEEGHADSGNEKLAGACLKEQAMPSDEQIRWKPRQTKADYLEQIRFLKDQIQLGNIYEVNYCQEFYAENVGWTSILPAYHALNAISKAPYSLLYESDDRMIASASPERFIRKQGNRLISEPIKGTARRGASAEEDERLRKQLADSHKDQTENVMIVDLVRNDLSRIAGKGTVRVDELFGIYTFPTVHQMISTVSCELKEGTRFTDILRATFPMGSMTGAPKVAAMDLAERSERFTRDLYSGSVGYITPEGDFDLNVMIRSLVLDVKNRYLSCGVGGAITIFSDPEEEYEECKTKVGRILETVGTCQW